MSFYRKYRPQTVKELDLDGVRASLSAVLQSGKFSQAYLFFGPKGAGKTSSARILAKVLNCEKNLKVVPGSPFSEPCNTCDSCTAITRGSSMAVVEMDAASNRGIDDIRQLKERIVVAPAQGKYVVYVVDEVHMLTTEAFNALLKTLEEPPKHAVFVLCTTEKHALPATIISRCTEIAFTKATPAEIARSLSKVIQGEKLQVNKEAVELIAARTDGSFRDAVKLLEQLAQENKQVSVEAVNTLTGYTKIYETQPLIEAMLQRDITKALEVLKKADTAGVDFPLFAKRLVERSRHLLVETLQKNDETTARALLHLAEVCNAAALATKIAVVPQLPLEIAIGKWCLSEDSQNLAKKKEQQKKAEKKVEALGKAVIPDGEVLHVGLVNDHWQEFLNRVRGSSLNLEAFLRAARPLRLEKGTLTLEVLYAFHKEQLEMSKHVMLMQEIMKGMFKQETKMVFVLAGASQSSVKKDDSADAVDEIL
jgi:DNA polymerase-3 subunit gamma/tau